MQTAVVDTGTDAEFMGGLLDLLPDRPNAIAR